MEAAVVREPRRRRGAVEWHLRRVSSREVLSCQAGVSSRQVLVSSRRERYEKETQLRVTAEAYGEEVFA